MPPEMNLLASDVSISETQSQRCFRFVVSDLETLTQNRSMNLGAKLGAAIRSERERRGWPIDELVERLGEIKGGDRASISKIETDQRWPSAIQLAAIAKAFEMSVSQLFAIAEGLTAETRPTYLVAAEANLLRRYKAMEPEARYHLDAVADALAERKRRE